MKRLTAIIMLLAVLCPMVLGCDSSTPTQNNSHTTSPESGAAANQTVAVADIEPNEEVIEINSNAWSVKYLEYPEDIMPNHKVDMSQVYYDTADK